MPLREALIQRRAQLIGAAISTARQGLRPGEERQLFQEIDRILYAGVSEINTEFEDACKHLELPVTRMSKVN